MQNVQRAAEELAARLQQQGIVVTPAQCREALAEVLGGCGAPTTGCSAEVISAANAVVDSADATGCSDDLTVVDAEGIERLREILRGQPDGRLLRSVVALDAGVVVRIAARGNAVIEASGLRDHFVGGAEDAMSAEERAWLSGAIDALESLLLALAAEGVDIGSRATRAAFRTAIESISNHRS